MLVKDREEGRECQRENTLGHTLFLDSIICMRDRDQEKQRPWGKQHQELSQREKDMGAGEAGGSTFTSNKKR